MVFSVNIFKEKTFVILINLVNKVQIEIIRVGPAEVQNKFREKPWDPLEVAFGQDL